LTQLAPPDSPAEPAGPVATTAAEKATIAVASQWRLVWRGFKAHRLAMAGLIVTLAIYGIAVFAEFLAPYSSGHFVADYAYAPPQRVHVISHDASGDLDIGLYVHDYQRTRDPETLQLHWKVDQSSRIELAVFARGEPYKLLGVVPTDIHLLGPADGTSPMYLLGADQVGHDLASRIIHGTRISMSIGLIGVALAFGLGIVLGGFSGYIGGAVDNVIQRGVEFLMSLPTLPLWLGLSAAIPRDWGPLQRYLAITVLLSMIAWTDLARVVRGRFLSLREEDFVLVANLDGVSRSRIIFRHMLPSFTSHLIAALTLSIPAMILAETSLSFLGLGLQAPVVSWGVLLQDAQSIRAVATAPWLLLPGVAVVAAVLALNFLGDGLRDAADPYKH
jgi:peptide/nickel transport system permease protein